MQQYRAKHYNTYCSIIWDSIYNKILKHISNVFIGVNIRKWKMNPTLLFFELYTKNESDAKVQDYPFYLYVM